MIIKGRLSFEDYRNYQMKYALPRYGIMFAIIAAGCFFLKFGNSLAERFNLPPLASNIGVSIIIAIFVVSVLFVSFYFRLKTLFNTNGALKIEQVYETSDEGINMKSENGDFMVKWTELKRVLYYKTYILIYTGRSLAMLIPHSFFSSERELVDFKSALARYTSFKAGE